MQEARRQHGADHRKPHAHQPQRRAADERAHREHRWNR
jgi:hypothetical protein